MTLPKHYPIELVAGDSYDLIVDYVDDAGLPIDLSGETVTMKFYSEGELLFTLTSGDGLTISAAAGRITVMLTDLQTDTLDGLPDRRYKLRLDTTKRTIMVGGVDVKLAV